MSQQCLTHHRAYLLSLQDIEALDLPDVPDKAVVASGTHSYFCVFVFLLVAGVSVPFQICIVSVWRQCCPSHHPPTPPPPPQYFCRQFAKSVCFGVFTDDFVIDKLSVHKRNILSSTVYVSIVMYLLLWFVFYLELAWVSILRCIISIIDNHVLYHPFCFL